MGSNQFLHSPLLITRASVNLLGFLRLNFLMCKRIVMKI